ncbi:hypothetical protein ACFVUS_36635 [Nocardia sp. NPDC058058]|uniref:hypothetical protein n=1 Tax=Nocardia sp. NPDC058058 TaxID=3346317 RepID=UPI0036DE10D5
MSTITLSKDDARTLQTAAYGVVTLLAAADPGVIASTKASVAAAQALRTATGLVGHALNDKPKPNVKAGTLEGVAQLVFPALTASVRLLEEKAPVEAENFRRTIATAVAAAGQTRAGRPHPATAELIREIDSALGN